MPKVDTPNTHILFRAFDTGKRRYTYCYTLTHDPMGSQRCRVVITYGAYIVSLDLQSTIIARECEYMIRR